MGNSSPSARVGGRPRNPAIKFRFLRTERERQELSRDTIVATMAALGMKISRTSLYMWEGGKCSPTPERLAAWCSALKLRPEDVLET